MVQLSADLVADLDREASERGVSRSALIRQAIEGFLVEQRVRRDVERVAAGYRATPVTAEEMAAAHENARALVAEEPW
jgi:metal-responsive CopG/Arc/MetJ family transcriptional regulator